MICTQERHRIPRPYGRAMGCLSELYKKNDRNISGAHCKIWLLGFGGERHIFFHSSGLVSATYVGSRVLSYVMKASTCHNTLHVNNWHRVRDIPPLHDDVIKRMHFPWYWPLVWGIHQSTVNSPHKGQWRGALLFLWYVSEETVEQKMETLVIWDATLLIMTSLKCAGV